MPTAHRRIVLSILRMMTEMAPAFDDLFGGTAADSQLQTPAGDEIRRTGILGHVVWVLIPHVNHRCADFNTPRFGADGGEQWERRRQLPGEVMNAKVGSIDAQPLGFDGKVNGLQQSVSRSSRF